MKVIVNKGKKMSDDTQSMENANASNPATLGLKNFRNHSDIENFYRFIYENDLRREALFILGTRFQEKLAKQANKK